MRHALTVAGKKGPDGTCCHGCSWRLAPTVVALSAFSLPVDSPPLPPATLQSPVQPAHTDEQQATKHCTHAAALLSVAAVVMSQLHLRCSASMLKQKSSTKQRMSSWLGADESEEEEEKQQPAQQLHMLAPAGVAAAAATATAASHEAAAATALAMDADDECSLASSEEERSNGDGADVAERSSDRSRSSASRHKSVRVYTRVSRWEMI